MRRNNCDRRGRRINPGVHAVLSNILTTALIRVSTRRACVRVCLRTFILLLFILIILTTDGRQFTAINRGRAHLDLVSVHTHTVS